MRGWSTATGQQVFTLADPKAKKTISFKNNKVVEATHDNMVGVRFLDTDNQLVTFGSRPITKAPFGATYEIKVWDYQARRLLKTIDTGSNRLQDVVVAGSASKLYALEDQGVVLLIDLLDGSIKQRSPVMESDAKMIVPSGDGKYLFVTAAKALYVIDAQILSIVGRVYASETGEWLVTTPEGFFSASRAGGGLLSIARGLNTVSIEQMWQSLFNPDLVRERLAGDPDHEVAKEAGDLDLGKVLDSGAAPGVQLVTPQDGAAATEEIVTAEARIEDKGGGIGRIEWRVNGVTVGVENATEGPDKLRTVTHSLALEPGDNVIEAIAYNKRNLLSAVPSRVSATWTPSGTLAKPKLHVIAVGINKYNDTSFRPLSHAVNDARAFGQALEAAGKDQYSGVEVTYVLDEEATAAGLERAITQAGSKTDPRDTFIFLAAAHGKSEDGRFHLIPQDYRSDAPGSMAEKSIGQNQLQDWFANRIKARHGLILLDTCESGAVVGGRPSGTDSASSEASLGRLNEATGRPVLTAAAANQVALEGYKGHGVFTYALLDALVNGDTNTNGDRGQRTRCPHPDAHAEVEPGDPWRSRRRSALASRRGTWKCADRIAIRRLSPETKAGKPRRRFHARQASGGPSWSRAIVA